MTFRAPVIGVCVAISLGYLCAGTLRAEESVDGLIAGLGADSFGDRETAGRKLRTVGESALPALRRAAKENEDPEIRFRAQQLISRITRDACISPSTGMQLVLIDAGEFMMGSPADEANRRDDERRHAVRVTKTFLLGAHEVTQAEYRAVMEMEPSWFRRGGQGRAKVVDKPTDRFAVESVSWFDTLEFCNRLSKLDGRPPYYQLRSVKRKANTIIAAEVTVLGGEGYRLPTEAEWEYACRAGGDGSFHAVEGKKSLRGNFQYRQTVLYGSSTKIAGLGRTTDVGSYAPNAWGLYDMHGNVAEWCWDWYDKNYYSHSPDSNPLGPEAGHHRAVRGGSWLVQQSSCRCATRFWHVPAEGTYYIGFRVARDASDQLVPDS